MSSGLMSCVRENSPPLEMSEGNDSGPMSLPTTTTTSSPISTPTADTQKRRRFHPLRNLRRIFKRRALNNCDGTTAASTISSDSLTPIQVDNLPQESMFSLTQSSPSSPLQHQLVKPSGVYLTNSRISQNFPTHSTSTPLGPAPMYSKMSTNLNTTTTTTTSSSATTTTIPFGHEQMIAEMATTVTKSNVSRSVVYSASSSSSSAHHYSKESRIATGAAESSMIMEENREMTDHQRSFSEGRLMDSDFNRDALSQSHDSVFSEAPTASSYSIGLKAELADVLRKRRNPRDASDEDLGLPRSPSTPQRHDTAINNSTIPSEVSSLSLLSMVSSDLDDDYFSHNHIKNDEADRTGSSVASSRRSPNTSKNSDDNIDLNLLTTTRLSHSAAKHKMAVRPKKKGPTRHRRPSGVRTQEIKVLPATPELNEDVGKMNTLDVKDNKAKSRSLPHGVNAKILEQHNRESNVRSVNIKKSKTEKESSSSSSSYYSSVSTDEKHQTFKEKSENKISINSTTERIKEDESGFFHRLWLRNSKRKNKVDECDKAENISNSIQKINSDLSQNKNNTTITIDNVNDDYSKLVEETRKEIRREIAAESKSELSVILNTFMMSGESDISEELLNNKPKSGPAARQRYIPKDLSMTPSSQMSTGSTLKPSEDNADLTKIQSTSESSDSYPAAIKFKINNESVKTTNPNDRTSLQVLNESSTPLSRSLTEECFHSTTLIREISLAQKMRDKEQLYEKRHQPKIIGLSPFQQKISRSIDTFNTSNTSINDDINTPQKQRKAVEKSKSFRTYTDNSDISNILKSNVPSLPDLSQSDNNQIDDLSLGFEINDNNLVKKNVKENLPLSHGIYTKNIILTTSKSNIPKITSKPMATSPMSPKTCIKNISEIENNIDQLVKSPFISVLRKSTSSIDSFGNKLPPNISISPMTTKKVELFENSDALKSTRNLFDSSLNTPQKHVTTDIPTKIATNPPNRVPLILKETPKIAESAIKSGAVTIDTPIVPKTPTKVKNDAFLAYSSLNSKTAKTIDTSSQQSTENLMSKSMEDEKCRMLTNSTINVVKMSKTVADSKQSVEKSKVFIAKESASQSHDNSLIKTARPTSISTDMSKKSNIIVTKETKRLSSENLDFKSPSAEYSPLTKIDITKVHMREKSTIIANESHLVERKSSMCETVKRTSGESEAIQQSTQQNSQNQKTNGVSKSRRNSAVIDSSVKNGLPEFMKIQLNRVDSSRPKSTVVLSKNTRDNSCEDLTRRYSNESVEIAETKSPLPSSPTSTSSPETKMENKRLSGNSTKAEDNNSNTVKCPPKKVDAESNVPDNITDKMSLSERRKFFSEEKAKVETKIERKKSICEDTRKVSLDDDSGVVVMRRKSIVLKDDSTPELMKVFARRSLKIKDDDMPLPSTDSTEQPSTKYTATVDSDKENNSSSEEKLNKLLSSQNEINIQQQVSQTVNDLSINMKNRNSITENRNSKAISINSSNNNNTIIGGTPTKSNGPGPPMLRQNSNSNNGYRNVPSTIFPKSNAHDDQLTSSIEKNNNKNINNNYNNIINNNNKTYINNNSTSSPMSQLNGNSNGNFKTNTRHTIGPSNITVPTSPTTTHPLTQSTSTTTIDEIQRNDTQKLNDNKFKGISQRKAEWEKRAKEALK